MTHAAGNEGYYNTAVGMSSLLSTTIGYENTAVGRAALFSNTTGYHNTALGSSSLIANTTGYNNTAVGVSSLAFNTTGFENVATGDGALSSNTTGAANVGIGYYAGAYNQTGNSNVLIGEYAGYGAINNSYSNNTFVGYQSGYVTTTGGSNTFIGYQSGYNSQAGSNNTFLGYQSGRGNALYTNSFNNTVIGYQAGVKTTTGTNSNTFIGYQSGNNSTGGANFFGGALAGYSNTTGDNSVALGISALYSNTTGVQNTAVGSNAGYSSATGSGNVFLGYQAGYNETGSSKLYIDNSNTATPLIYGDFSTNAVTINGDLAVADAEEYFIGSTQVLSKGNGSLTGNLFVGDGGGSTTHGAGNEGWYNTSVGLNALQAVTTGYSNTAVGLNALAGDTAGYNNIGLGLNTLIANTTGANNIAIGAGPLASNVSGSANIAIGTMALDVSTTDNNLAVGANALGDDTTGTANIALGNSAGLFNVTGSNNTLLGYESGRGVSTNSYSDNTFIGYQTGYSTTTGGNNFFGGYQAGYSNASGAGNIFLGYQAGYSETGSNKLYVDNSNTASPLLYGDFSTDTLVVNGTVGINTAGPDRRFDILDTANPQLRLTQTDGSIFTDFQVMATTSDLQITTASSGDLVLTNAGTEIKIKESTGNTFYGIIDIGDLAADSTYTISGPSGNVVTTTTEANFTAAGRHARRIQLNAEYPGSLFTKFYGAGTDTSTTGSMNSDAEPAADNLRTYFEWSSSEASLNYYTVAVRITLPQDFDAWATSNAVQVDIDTESTDTANNLVSAYIYNGDDTPGTGVASDITNASASGDTWETLTIDDSAIDDGSAPDWDGAGETAVIYLRLGSKSDNFARIGDIKLNYLSKW